MKNNALAPFNGGKSSLQRNISNDCVITAVQKNFGSGLEIIIGIKIPHCAKKADYAPVLKELTWMGFSQKTSAFLTDISQSYVSKLLKK